MFRTFLFGFLKRKGLLCKKISKYLRTEEFLKQMYMYRTGAAIPNVSDVDLANIEVYLPTDNRKEIISAQIRKAFDLKQAFKNQIECIYLEVD